ncbi:MAG: hypothetical protein U0237_00115 [Thermoleophilia bacterium]
MNLPTHPLRRLAVLLLAASAVTAAPAVADTPVVEVPASFTESDLSGGSLVPDGPPSRAAVRGYPGQGATGGHWAMQRYCTPYGSGTAIVGFQYEVGRWHTSVGDAAAVLANTDTGTVRVHDDAALAYRRADALGPWSGAQAAMAPSRCVALQVVMRRAVAATTLTWTTNLTRVAVIDQVGPSVTTPVVDTAWVTGDAVPVHFGQADNAFARGAVTAETLGGGTTALGDPGDGTVAAQVPVGALPDGQHVVRVSRSAPGWDTRSAVASFDLDRTPPSVPERSAATEAWTAAPAVWITSDPSADGAGSGWSHNEFSVDGGPWAVQPNRWAVEAAGVHQVRARAVDRVGHASAASPARTVRIDRTPPELGALEVDVAAQGGPLLRLSLADAGGSGLGGCQAVVALAGPGTPWTPAVELPGSALAGAGQVKLPMRGLPSGDYQVRVSACDVAGNTTSRAVRLTWHPSGATADQPAARPTGTATEGTAALRVAGASPSRAVHGRRVRIGGTLLRGGVPVAGAAIQVLDPGGSVAGSGHTGAGGRIVATAVATRGGAWRIRVVGQDWTAAAFRLDVRPAVTVRATTAGGVVTTGVRVLPAASGRLVRLQRRTSTGWATFVTGRTGADGTVRLGAAKAGPRQGSGPRARPLPGPARRPRPRRCGRWRGDARRLGGRRDPRGGMLAPVAAVGNGAPVLAPYLVMPASGVPTSGVPVGVEPGVWDGAPTGFEITWQRCTAGTLDCSAVDGAAGREYRPAAADAGMTLRAVVRPLGTGGAPAATATSPVVRAGSAGPVAASGGDGGGKSTVSGIGGPVATGLPARLRLGVGGLREVRGTLVAPAGGVLAGEAVELRDPAGLVMAAGRTGTDGGFRIAARFSRPGDWTVAGDGWRSTVHVDLRPLVRITRATRAVRAPGTVRVAGTVRPAVSGKLVQLQYLDPGRGWRLWRQSVTGRGGRFAIARTLRPNPLAPRFTLRVRVAVPADVGWPYAPATTAPLAVRVR